MRTVGLALLALSAAMPASAYADTADFAFLVQQRVTAMECPGYPADPIAINDAIMAEGKRLGWSRQETIREMEGRRLHQVARHKSNPSGYCRQATDMEAANKHRLRNLGVRP
ncbi:exported protein of unknown function [Pseudorhizobium banfieldiae]|uniref:DUF4148 domain-containing protein n=1 Tax=Pseudorhizobium banfieldiae TaxID=1125847 RepID=L0NFP4_9HYPH|nr:hypothetical protein [Pseudorhizobium banfieldiae]CAD6606066.1 hypothetical protein RNT25_01776 [arsenite-oxidising bacterium NT-25]CCF19122.1 exported protein of unknown function [Pseudorhizobium banfieldiae]